MKTLKNLLLSLLLLTTSLGLAQGIVPYNSYSSYKYDTINNANLNLLVTVPVRSKAGIFPFNANLVMNGSGTSYYFTLSVDGLGTGSYLGQYLNCPYPNNHTMTHWYRGFYFTDSTGAVHSFPNINFDTVGCENDLGNTDIATDGSGLAASATLNADGTLKEFVVTDDVGHTLNVAGTSTLPASTDLNGNTLTLSSNQYTDVTNTVVLTTYAGTRVATDPDKYSYTDGTGTTQNVKMYWGTYTQQASWGCSGGFGDVAKRVTQLQSQITFPDGSSIQIGYEHETGTDSGTVTGRVSSLTLPTGGTINYTYSGPNNGYECGNGATVARQENGLTTTYVHSIPTGTYGLYNQTVITLPLSGTRTVLAGLSGAVFSDITKDSSNNVIGTTLTTYNGGTYGNTYAPPINHVDTYTYRGASTVTAGSRHVLSTLDTTMYALPTEVKTFIPATSGTPYTDTTISYFGQYDKVLTSVSKDSGNNTLSSITNTYDARGNQLGTSSLVSGTTYKTTASATYNSNGSVLTSTDMFGAVTTNSATSCNSTLPTTKLFNGFTTTFGWDCNGGVVNNLSDLNGPVSAVYADPLYRPSSITDQTLASVGMSFTPTSFTSSQAVNGSTVQSITTADTFGNVVSSQIANGSAYDTTSKAYSGSFLTSSSLPCSTATLGGTCPTTKFSYSYDTVGRLISKTDVTVTPNATTTYVYNTNDTKVTTSGGTSPVISTQTEVDGLGRVISVCEITTLSGSADCGQTGAASGFLTAYAYTAQGFLSSITQFSNGTPQVRSFTYDLLGRKLTETTPEAGLVQFWYDTAPSIPGVACSGTYNGKLVKRYDALFNTTCYTYDSVGRQASVVYSGPGSTGVNKYFVYDSAVVNSQTMLNTTNRLAEAYTATSVGGTKITDFGFSYNARGDKTDVYEKTPNSGGYYHTTASYFSNGAINTLNGVPSSATNPSGWTFGVDALGRLSSIVESTNCVGTCHTVLSSVGYTLGRVTGINYGSGDSDSFTYSSTSGQETAFHLNSGQKYINSAITWFPTGQLQQQVITDTVTAANAQTCTYGYDALDRLTSNNCGTAWSQTFSYDQFGNLVQSGSSSFAALFDNHNRITNMSASYDASGNLLSINTGTVHTYTWDAENRIASIDGKALVYDAFDRVVEESATSQILYSPAGKLAFMNGQTTKRVYIGLPKSAQLTYDSSKLNNPIYHHPDLMGNGVLGTGFTKNKAYDRFFAPYGEQYENTGTPVADFTGHFQDLDANLFDFEFREQSPIQGRWLNPDPSGMSAVSLGDPQTLNRYAYVRGSAMSMTDPNGLRGNPRESFWSWMKTLSNGTPNVYDFAVPDWMGGFSSSHDFPGQEVGGGSTGPSAADIMEANHNKMDKQLDAIATADAMQAASVLPPVVYSFNFIGSVPPEPIGPAISVAYNPSSANLFIGFGLGASEGKNLSWGVLSPIPGTTPDVDKVLSGGSISPGYNWPDTVGYQFTSNLDGTLVGGTLGVPGTGASATYSLGFNVDKLVAFLIQNF